MQSALIKTLTPFSNTSISFFLLNSFSTQTIKDNMVVATSDRLASLRAQMKAHDVDVL